MAEDEGETRGPGDHRDHGQPEVGHVLGGEPPVANAEHVRHRLEAGMNICRQQFRSKIGGLKLIYKVFTEKGLLAPITD